MATEQKRLILLDTHAILHRAYHALPDFASSKGEPTGALYGLSTMLIKIIQDLKPDYIAACLDLPGKTYRHEAYDQYKAGRKKTDDDLVRQIKRVRDVFTALSIPMYEEEGFEADDMLGTIVEQSAGKGVDVIIASGDMDTLQLVKKRQVQVYTLKKGINDTILYDEAAVKERFGFGPLLLPDYKGLRGDPSDNIIGIAGIGEKTATELITNFGSIEDIYKKLKKDRQAFLDVGIKERIIGLLEQGEEEARFSKMLATIRRDAPISFSIPAKTWSEGIDLSKAKALFAELEFRTLGARLEAVLSGKADEKQATASIAHAPKKALEKVPPQELEETALALWVVDSNITDPSQEDIMQFTKAQDFATAKKVIMEELKKRGGDRVYHDIELPLMPIVKHMQEHGVLIDTARLGQLSKEYHQVLEKIEKKIYAAAGKTFNINSPKQLGDILFDTMQLTAKNLKKTEGGARSTRESELLKLAESNPIVKDILEYRELQKLLSTYIDTIPTMLDEKGRLHASFLQMGTTTGRMSSNTPNLQNIPVKTDLGRAIREAFIAPKGFTLVAFDYSQIELRIAAFLSGDEKLIDIFKRGEDVHSSVAASVFKVPIEKVDYEMRRRAKVINFGIMYGMGVNALRANLGTDRKEAQAFYDQYFETFTGLASYLDGIKASAARTGYTETFFGRRRYFEGITSRIPYIKASAERMAINAPIQGTEADIVKLSMVRVDAYLREQQLDRAVFPILQVHDELVFEIQNDALEKAVPAILRIMREVMSLKDTKGVPIEVHEKRGVSWGTMEEQ
jgi:DNA polymerase I